MKVVSLVPSLTETLIECGADVVGRTRFCIHPDRAKSIASVGGTKSIDLEKLLALKPDLVILDREENTKEMFDAISNAGLKTVVTHIRSLDDVARDLRVIAKSIGGARRNHLLSPLQSAGAMSLLVGVINMHGPHSQVCWSGSRILQRMSVQTLSTPFGAIPGCQ